ncbi:MAG: Glu/Leu/Phe/Val dehydrogenase [Myxococcales bacterium]|nr:Glu/Leu/Phe/Val dehydrogenase [Myxococcales bacterium]
MLSEWRQRGEGSRPSKIVLIRDSDFDLEAIVVIDDTACGPAIGGVRMGLGIEVDEVRRLARTMTLKNAAAGLPHGGAKAAILAKPGLEARAQESLLRALGRAIRDLRDYIPGPDMGTDERCMAWLADEGVRACGLPRVLGGIPLDRIGATGFGLAIAAEAAQERSGIRLEGARVAVQGFGHVGRHACRYLQERGAIIVAVADSQGAVLDPEGLELDLLETHKDNGHSFGEWPSGGRLPTEAVISAPCDIWIPAAQPDVIHARNVGELQTGLVIEGANIPLTLEAETSLRARGVLVIPDFIANAGGVICAAAEVAGLGEKHALASIEEKIARNTREMLDRAHSEQRSPREAALVMARARLAEAHSYHRKP